MKSCPYCGEEHAGKYWDCDACYEAYRMGALAAADGTAINAPGAARAYMARHPQRVDDVRRQHLLHARQAGKASP